MIGSVIGDVIGSVYEFRSMKRVDFPLFAPLSRCTDDTILSIAVAEAILSGEAYGVAIRRWARKYPDAGYGGNFYKWMRKETPELPEPYFSFGNGSAMRVGPVGWAFETLEDTVEEARRSAECTHNHPEGIKGAQAVAAAVFLARRGDSKKEIKEYLASRFAYDLDRTIDAMRPYYSFEVSCMDSVPQSIIAFLESTDFENAIRLAVSLGGDSDTMACIAGSIAEAFYREIPQKIVEEVRRRLDEEILDVLDRFEARYGSGTG